MAEEQPGAAEPAGQATQVELDGSWAIAGRLHGGYLTALLAEAALDAHHPDPLAVSATFLSSPAAGPAELHVDRLRTGRRVAQTRCRLVQGGHPCAEALVTSGTLRDEEPRFALPAPAAPPDPEGITRAPALQPGGWRVGQLDHVDLRMDPATAGWAVGRPAHRAEYRAWLRRDDAAPASALDLLVFGDALPPVTFDLGLQGWVPTLEYTVLVRGVPRPGWLHAEQRAALVGTDLLDEECLIWDEAGRLVAQARQLASYRAG